MTFTATLWHWLWFAQTVGHLVLFAVLVRRKVYQEFPIFVSYVASAGVLSGTLLILNYAPQFTGEQYYSAYVGVIAVLTTLRFGIVYELLGHVLRDYPALSGAGKNLFAWAGIVLMFMAIGFAWLAPAGGSGHVMAVIYLLNRTADLLVCGLLLLLFILRSYFNLTWRSYAFGIAFGLGFSASTDLASDAIRSQIEPITRNLNTHLLDALTQGATLGSILIWAAYVLAREDKPQIRRDIPKHDLENWNQELQRLLHQ
ncbi:MAG TPA: hypothetical protein VFB28_09140 [Terriglobales bacterium]|jgi:hypothetical protein|nr:hypothetical protein [Terriglobales bacterium]